MRRALSIVAVVLVVAAALLGVQLLLSSRDDPGLSSAPASKAGPGTLLPDHGRRHTARPERPPERGGGPPASGPHRPKAVRADGARLDDDQVLHALEAGNVVLLYDGPRPPRELVAVQRDVAGAPFSPALARSGEAVILARRAGTRGVVALAWRHRLRAPAPGDPRVREFADHWLGAGAA